MVNPDCTLPGHPEVFVIGDMMSLNGYPGVAQVAMQQGRDVYAFTSPGAPWNSASVKMMSSGAPQWR